MRKLASYIFIFILLAGIFTPFYSVSAQEAPTPTPASTPNSATSGTLGSNEEGNKAGDKKDDLQIQPQGSCGFICWGILTSIQEVTYWILQIMSLFIWLAGSILDKVLSFTIIEFKDNIDRMQGIQVAWILVRDLMNLGFVFLLLYQGLRMILGRSNNAKNVIFGIVLASILINFSLFMTKVIIDASNVVTIGFYNAIVEGSQVTEISSTSNTETKGRELKEGLSGAYVNALGVNSFYSKDSLPPQTPNNQINLIIIMLAGSILFLMVSVIFLAMAIMFLIRYAVLIVLMMLSPLAVMGIAIPQIQSLQKKWWDALLGQSLFGPAYMIMTWIILTLISSQGFNPLANQNANWTKLFIGGEADSVGLIINFIVIIVLTIMSLTIAKQQADKGGVKMSQWTTKATTFAGGVALGGTAALGRNTVGASADRLAQSRKFQEWAGRSRLGEGLLKTTRGVASGSFDVRRSRAGEAVTKATGVDLGHGIPWNQKAGEGGFTKTHQDKTEKREKFGKSLGTDAAKEMYAERLSNKKLVRGGSSSSYNTLFGVMGRSNRVIASKILNDQITPLTAKEETLQNRENQLNQQIANMTNEITTLSALNNGAGPTIGTPQRTRLDTLQDATLNPPPAGSPPGTPPIPANRNSLIFAQYQLNGTQADLARLAGELGRLRGLVTSNGLTNTNPRSAIINPVTGTSRQPRADEQNY